MRLKLKALLKRLSVGLDSRWMIVFRGWIIQSKSCPGLYRLRFRRPTIYPSLDGLDTCLGNSLGLDVAMSNTVSSDSSKPTVNCSITFTFDVPGIRGRGV